MAVHHHNPHEFLHDGRAAAVAGGVMALIVVAAGIAARARRSHVGGSSQS